MEFGWALLQMGRPAGWPGFKCQSMDGCFGNGEQRPSIPRLGA